MTLNTFQQKAVDTINGNICVIASAGSGKTRTIIERVHNLVINHGIDPNKILTISFTRQAANILNDRLTQRNPLLKWVNTFTFHSLCYSLINYPTILKGWEYRSLIKSIAVEDLKLYSREKDVPVGDIMLYFSEKNNNLKNEEIDYDYEKIYEIYNQKRQGRVTFDDMLIDCLSLMRKAPEQFGKIYDYIIVDEFQDTNTVQIEILKLLNGNKNNLLAVGDILQNIFQFRHSYNKFMINFETYFDNPIFLNLPINYRSDNNIVELSNKLMVNTFEANNKHYLESISNTREKGIIEYTHYSSDEKEAIGIANIISEKINNSSEGKQDIAILTRTNYQQIAIASELTQKGIPFKQESNFFDSYGVKIVLDYIRLSLDRNDDEAFVGIYDRPTRYLGKVFLDKIMTKSQIYKCSLYKAMLNYRRESKRGYESRYNNCIDNFIHDMQNVDKLILNESNVSALIDKIIKVIKLEDFLNKNNDDVVNNHYEQDLEDFKILATKYDTLEELLNVVTINSTQDESDKMVSLMTIHKSKGMEFEIVFLVGVCEGILPHIKATNTEEERRIMYVAMTRAEKELYISSYDFLGDRYYGESRFLNIVNENNYVKIKDLTEQEYIDLTPKKDNLTEKNRKNITNSILVIK